EEKYLKNLITYKNLFVCYGVFILWKEYEMKFKKWFMFPVMGMGLISSSVIVTSLNTNLNENINDNQTQENQKLIVPFEEYEYQKFQKLIDLYYQIFTAKNSSSDIIKVENLYKATKKANSWDEFHKEIKNKELPNNLNVEKSYLDSKELNNKINKYYLMVINYLIKNEEGFKKAFSALYYQPSYLQDKENLIYSSIINDELAYILKSNLIELIKNVFTPKTMDIYYEFEKMIFKYSGIKEEVNAQLNDYWENDEYKKALIEHLFNENIFYLFKGDIMFQWVININTNTSFFKMLLSNNFNNDAKIFAIHYLNINNLLTGKYELAKNIENIVSNNEYENYLNIQLNETDEKQVNLIVSDIEKAKKEFVDSLYITPNEAQQIKKEFNAYIRQLENELGISLSDVRNYLENRELAKTIGENLNILQDAFISMLSVMSKTDDKSKLELKLEEINTIKQSAFILKELANKVIDYMTTTKQIDLSQQKGKLNSLNLETDNINDLVNNYHEALLLLSKLPFTEEDKDTVFSEKFDKNFNKIQNRPEMITLLNALPKNTKPQIVIKDAEITPQEDNKGLNPIFAGLISATVVCGIAALIGLGLLIKRKK
ncbi:hypothetical protein, partial [Mycoplasma sp. 31_09]|uniref:hypothetical protein n=1 Tax=Mycoplasma sp. 31_09 TaxID=3401663 RepID=UPI003AAE8ADF